MDTVHECDRRTDRRTELRSQRPCNAERRTVKINSEDDRNTLKDESDLKCSLMCNSRSFAVGSTRYSCTCTRKLAVK